MPRLVVIGVVAGFFSALFGVGGGIVVVPLLIVVASFAERRAMATSLAAIGIIAMAGTVAYTLHDHIDPVMAALVGVPATLGAVAGATLQQRVASRALALAFSGLLVGVAVTLLVR